MAPARSWARRILRGLLFAAIGWVALSVVCVLTLRFVDPFSTAFILRDRLLAWAHDEQTYVYRRKWVDLKQIARPMQLAVIASEDQTFPTNWGFDVKSINQAIGESEHGQPLRGASTITQQVAKNLFLWPGHSWLRKGIEAYFTVLIEGFWPKRRILEMYLNIAEFGRGVYGVEAASRAYYRKPAARLNEYDAALLAAVLPNPKRFRADAPGLHVRSRQRWIVGQMREMGGVTYLNGGQ